MAKREESDLPNARQREKRMTIVGANYTDEGSLKRTDTLITVDRDAIGRRERIAFGE